MFICLGVAAHREAAVFSTCAQQQAPLLVAPQCWSLLQSESLFSSTPTWTPASCWTHLLLTTWLISPVQTHGFWPGFSSWILTLTPRYQVQTIHIMVLYTQSLMDIGLSPWWECLTFFIKSLHWSLWIYLHWVLCVSWADMTLPTCFCFHTPNPEM